jgi:hypothetical protein
MSTRRRSPFQGGKKRKVVEGSGHILLQLREPIKLFVASGTRRPIGFGGSAMIAALVSKDVRPLNGSSVR